MAHFDKAKVGDENYTSFDARCQATRSPRRLGLATMAILKRPGRLRADPLQTGRELMARSASC